MTEDVPKTEAASSSSETNESKENTDPSTAKPMTSMWSDVARGKSQEPNGSNGSGPKPPPLMSINVSKPAGFGGNAMQLEDHTEDSSQKSQENKSPDNQGRRDRRYDHGRESRDGGRSNKGHRNNGDSFGANQQPRGRGKTVDSIQV